MEPEPLGYILALVLVHTWTAYFSEPLCPGWHTAGPQQRVETPPPHSAPSDSLNGLPFPTFTPVSPRIARLAFSQQASRPREAQPPSHAFLTVLMLDSTQSHNYMG